MHTSSSMQDSEESEEVGVGPDINPFVA